MIAIGFALFAFGAIAGVILQTPRHGWDWRDWFSTTPMGIGFLIMLAGVVRWLWMVAP